MSKLKLYLKNSLLSSIVIISFAATSQEIEEVVVTSTKKAESIQDLALSIEALSAEDLADNMVENIDDLAEVIPGLITSKGIGSGSAYSIRGTGSYGVGAAVVGAVVTASNGHSYNSSTIADIGFFDVERVEVLKGPQGTLSGRNAVAGLINMITARPTSELEGSVSVQMGNLNSQTTNMVFNMPINDSVRTRFALNQKTRDGMTKNINTGNDFNDIDAFGARFSIDADLGEYSTLQFTYERYEGDDNRSNVATSKCQPHPVLGCHPLEKRYIEYTGGFKRKYSCFI